MLQQTKYLSCWHQDRQSEQQAEHPLWVLSNEANAQNQIELALSSSWVSMAWLRGLCCSQATAVTLKPTQLLIDCCTPPTADPGWNLRQISQQTHFAVQAGQSSVSRSHDGESTDS